ncbi:MAG: glycosyltransferase family 39 protein [Candidatus Binatia bacterium]|nr:glycosyltransferase family 39 protein [Candidatus Binatia bacterium]
MSSLGLLFVVALALRLWGSVLGLPHEYLPDESQNLRVATGLAGKDYTPPGIQPGFLFYTLAAVLPVLREAGLQLAWIAGDVGQRVLSTGLSLDLWAGRAWMAVLSAATVVPLYLIGLRVWSVPAGLFAAFLFAVNPVSIAAAGYIKEDTPLTLWMSVTALAAVRRLESRARGDAALCGLAAGLCAGSKFSGVSALALALLPEVWLRRERAATHFSLVVAMAAIGFLATTPWIIWDPWHLVEGMEYQAAYALAGHHDGISLPIWKTWGFFYLTRSLLPAMGVAGLALAAWGARSLLLARRDFALVLLAWTLGYLAMMEVVPAKPYPFFSRYVMPGLAGLCVVGGIGLAELRAMAVGEVRLLRRVFAGVVLSIALILPAQVAGRFVHGMYPDTRDLARDWIVDHARGGQVFFASPYAPPLADAGFKEFHLTLITESRRCRTWPLHLVTSSLALDRFRENPEAASERRSRVMVAVDRATAVKSFRSTAPRFGFSNPEIEILRIDPNSMRQKEAHAYVR